MHILVTGAAGMVGRRLVGALLDGAPCRGGRVTSLDLLDIVPASPTDRTGGDVEVRSLIGDLSDPATVAQVVGRRPDVVFHLAGVVSGEAEQDRAKGYRVNLDGTRNLFDALAEGPGTPRVVFTSSIAVFGAPFPEVIPDDFHLTPLTSYGTQKAMGEALLADHSRRGLIDGIGIRLPTITVRPGRPNAAASGFFSGIIREPVAGERAVLPVPRTIRHPHASPSSAVGFLLRAAELDGADVGLRRNLTMPGVSVTVAEQIEALARAVGDEAVDLIDDEPDPEIAAMVGGWPERFAAERARELGFRCEDSYDEIVAEHLATVADGRRAEGGTTS